MGKVFGIGLSKTGTSSLRVALEMLGYRMAPPNKRLLSRLKDGRLGSVLDYTRAFDGFEDFPYPLIFRELYQRYGDTARYILTTRSSPQRWYESICDHCRTSRLFSGQFSTYGYYRPFGREAEYVRIYESHNAAVRQFFADQSASDLLLEICWENGDGWEALCGFLGCAVPESGFPHANKSDRSRHVFRRKINALIEAVYPRLISQQRRARPLP
jgi:Sulfotransferase domain